MPRSLPAHFNTCYVACRRPLSLQAPPPGLRWYQLPPWRPLLVELDFAPVQVWVVQSDSGGSPELAAAWACACADATDGLMLTVQPVTAPPRLAIEYQGDAASPPADAAALHERAQRYLREPACSDESALDDRRIAAIRWQAEQRLREEGAARPRRK